MTTIYRKAQKTVEYDVFVRCTCDGCDKELPQNYGNESHHSRKFELKFESGSSYPEGGSGTGWRVHDLCDDCVARLHSLLVTHHFSVEEYEWDF